MGKFISYVSYDNFLKRKKYTPHSDRIRIGLQKVTLQERMG